MSCKYLFYLFFSVVFISMVISCNPSNKISNQNAAALYNPENNLLHPQFVVYHFSSDSSRLFVKVSLPELLHKKMKMVSAECR